MCAKQFMAPRPSRGMGRGWGIPKRSPRCRRRSRTPASSRARGLKGAVLTSACSQPRGLKWLADGRLQLKKHRGPNQPWTASSHEDALEVVRWPASGPVARGSSAVPLGTQPRGLAHPDGMQYLHATEAPCQEPGLPSPSTPTSSGDWTRWWTRRDLRHEQAGLRPVLILSHDVFNARSVTLAGAGRADARRVLEEALQQVRPPG